MTVGNFCNEGGLDVKRCARAREHWTRTGHATGTMTCTWSVGVGGRCAGPTTLPADLNTVVLRQCLRRTARGSVGEERLFGLVVPWSLNPHVEFRVQIVYLTAPSGNSPPISTISYRRHWGCGGPHVSSPRTLGPDVRIGDCIAYVMVWIKG